MRTVIVIEHIESREPDFGVRHLESRGLNVRMIRPYRGEPLPDLAEATAGVMVLGGPQMVTEREDAPYLDAELDFLCGAMASGTRLLGICLGGQMIAHRLGARVGYHPEGKKAWGYYPLRATGAPDNPIPDGLMALAGNAQGFGLAPGAELLAAGDLFPHQAFRHGENTIGLQFHPEVTKPILDQWHDEFPAWECAPGAQPKDVRDLAFEKHDPALKAWYAGFLDRWFV